MRNVRNFSREYTIRGIAKVTIWKKDSKARLLTFSHIVSVTPHTKALANKQKRRALLEKEGWVVKLSPLEREEMRHEARTADLRREVYLKRAQCAATVGKALSASRAELGRQDRAWGEQKVVPSPALPMGMRFSQSPDYAACLAAFHKVNELANRSGFGDAALDAIDRIGILHASAVYERWCLVKIISVLIESYGFSPDAGWHDLLIQCVTGRPDSLALNFSQRDLDLFAKLEVQPVLANGRRPDFRLRFGWRSSPAARTGLVMDAKFRTRWRSGELGLILDELLEAKEYAQEGDRVFILQPAPDTVAHATSPLKWGRDCDYGHDFGQNHGKGTIYLAPEGGAQNPVENLRRLIALELQAAFPAPQFDTASNQWSSTSICIRCGRKHSHDDIREHKTGKGNTYWILTCGSCGTATTRVHCYAHNCGTILFKNGVLFTYHKTLADQITNVVCPECGNYLDNDLR